MADPASMMQPLIKPGEPLLGQFSGLSSGLNARPSSSRLGALAYVVPDAVVVGWAKKPGFGRALAERFERRELMTVVESDVPITGFEGELVRRNSKHMVGRLLGGPPVVPAVTIKTTRGDLVFAFSAKNRGQARQLYVSLMNLIG